MAYSERNENRGGRDCVTYKQQAFFSHSYGGWSPKIISQHGWALGRALFQVAKGCFLLVSSHAGEHREEARSPVTLIRAPIHS